MKLCWPVRTLVLPSVYANDYPVVLVWCEKFSMFIGSAKLK